MCVAYLDPCGRGEHEWAEPPKSNFRHCKRCGFVLFQDDTKETLQKEVSLFIRQLKWKRRAIEAHKYAQWLSEEKQRKLIEAMNEVIVYLEGRET